MGGLEWAFCSRSTGGSPLTCGAWPENAERLGGGGMAHALATSNPHFRHHSPFTPAIAATPTPPHPRKSTAAMSDNENSDNGDELVTKPFKFVTGK